jgi:hypothetical protein
VLPSARQKIVPKRPSITNHVSFQNLLSGPNGEPLAPSRHSGALASRTQRKPGLYRASWVLQLGSSPLLRHSGWYKDLPRHPRVDRKTPLKPWMRYGRCISRLTIGLSCPIDTRVKTEDMYGWSLTRSRRAVSISSTTPSTPAGISAASAAFSANPSFWDATVPNRVRTRIQSKHSRITDVAKPTCFTGPKSWRQQ